MSPRVTVRDESQKNSEDGSNAWKEYAMKNSVVLERVIREITQQEDKLLNKLSKAANTISKTSLGSSVIMIRLKQSTYLTIPCLISYQRAR